ncbi:hypothetical protein Pla123a_16570 [Posidoniimonas polymericola]|uniref:Uncharacterized protein n=1 Tax=Posidoniimonas polymericola TaxID=2528002 RepID=A0A5C5YSD6_9BACT|nr:hypothetical protein [Posidoniimonas polymericola]TWT77859.1 hypothetical protein Pla123a_16570 [Posidoniimonas polymericola]
MQRREFIGRVVLGSWCGVGVASSTGCGTIFHQDRVHQPHSNQLDWKIVAADALGLILFFVPGVIAFAVDFYTGAIYLPYAAYGAAPVCPPVVTPQCVSSFETLELPPGVISQRSVEEAVAARTGKAISLSDANTRAGRLESIDQFTVVHQRLQGEPDYGVPSGELLRRLPPV